MKRGDLPLSATIWQAKEEKASGWEEWFKRINSIPEYAAKLNRAGVKRSINITTAMDVKRDKAALAVLLARRNTCTHTFIVSWGEFTPTLEDVMELLQLLVFGDSDLAQFTLNSEEQKAYDYLEKVITNSGKKSTKFPKKKAPTQKNEGVEEKGGSRCPNYATWVRFFFEEFGPDGQFVEGDGAKGPYVF